MLAYSPVGGFFIRFYDDFDTYPNDGVTGLASGYHILSSGPFVRRVTTGYFYSFHMFGWDDFDSYISGNLADNTDIFNSGVNSGCYFYNGRISVTKPIFGWDDFDSYSSGDLSDNTIIFNNGVNSGCYFYDGRISVTKPIFGWDDFDSYATGDITSLAKIFSGVNSGISLYDGFYAASGSIPL